MDPTLVMMTFEQHFVRIVNRASLLMTVFVEPVGQETTLLDIGVDGV